VDTVLVEAKCTPDASVDLDSSKHASPRKALKIPWARLGFLEMTGEDASPVLEAERQGTCSYNDMRMFYACYVVYTTVVFHPL
jgi:hypothetical protein